MQRRSAIVLTAGLATVVFAMTVRSFNAAPDPMLIARWWPATAVATALLLITRRQHLPLVGGALGLAFVLGGLVPGEGPFFSVAFALINMGEAVLVLWFLTRLREGRPELRAWRDYRRWLGAITAASVLSAVLITALIWVSEGTTPWRTFMWVSITHLGAQTVVLPLAMRWPRQRVRVTLPEILAHLALMALALAMVAVADASAPVAFLLLPLLMWAAARFSSRWASVELLVAASVLTTLTALGRGPFEATRGHPSALEIAASPQTFVAVSGITVVAFSVAMCHLRDSLRRIRENELQLSQLLDSASGTAFIATDRDGTITLFSPGAEQLLGYAAEEVVGRTSAMTLHEKREVVARARELGIAPGYAVVTAPLESGSEQDTRDWTYIRKDRSRMTVSLSATAVRDQDGRPVSYLHVVRDVTDRRAAEQALVFALDKEREANTRMQELDRAKREFVSAVSHELRTPLSSIIGYTELLSEGVSGALTDAQLELVDRIDRNGERLLQLVEDLLTLARVEEGTFAVELAAADLCECVRSAVRTVAPVAAARGVEVQLSLPATPVTLEGDRATLERLVVNLVDNGVKFTPAGGRVDVALEVNGDVGVLSVRDTGMGIPLEEQDRLFQRFFRSSLATEHAIQGTGLGLNIVRSIAEAHHGQITFESTPDVGTTVWFTVPLSASPAYSSLASPPAQR